MRKPAIRKTVWFSPGQRRHLNAAIRKAREATARECVEMIRIGGPSETTKIVASIRRRFRLKQG